ncbi:ParB family protein [Aeromicrobium camelliae]|uniref:ParB family protein n=1 Tax=Aeromicrobium camelliae TaxID=1538144 RepID=UPI001FB6C9FD|nr:hypothetical protein [Aeromicrobium camelliae]
MSDPAPEETQSTRSAASTSTPKAEKKPAAKKKYPSKASFYQDPEDTARVRGAILYTMATEGPRSFSDFVHAAVMAEVERLEAKYNDGKQFPGVGPRELPQGRPMGK